MSYAQFLAKVPLFGVCSPTELEAIVSVAQINEFHEGQIIVTQGTPGSAFYLIVSGRVEIFRNDSSIGTLNAGDFFGEMSLLDSAPRSATIRALEPTTCMMLSGWDFKSLLEDHPHIAIKLLEVLSRRLRMMDERAGR